MGHNMVCDQRGGYCALNCHSDDWKQGCCRNISSSFGAPSWEHWDVCQDQLAERCLVISVGLGGSFFFEDGLAALGCEVHAFDPTISLRATHAAHARRRGWKFHNVTSGLKNHYGALNNASMLSLREIVSIATGGASDRHVDVIKIDCEGCEWGMFRERATSVSQLQRVSQVLLELHMTPSYGFYGAAQLLQMMHLLTEHDFFLRRTRVNAGFLKDINQTDPVMVDAGWKLVGPHGTIVPCCIELHWNRKVVAESEAKSADKRAVASLSGAASSSNSSIYQMSNSRGRNAVSLQVAQVPQRGRVAARPRPHLLHRTGSVFKAPAAG